MIGNEGRQGKIWLWLISPQGTLFHDYGTDENGLLTRLNLIVATGNNNWAMNTAAGQVAKAFVDGNKLTEGMLNRVEAGKHEACGPCIFIMSKNLCSELL